MLVGGHGRVEGIEFCLDLFHKGQVVVVELSLSPFETSVVN